MKKLVAFLCSLPVLLLCTWFSFADVPPIEPTEAPEAPGTGTTVSPLLIVLVCAVLLVCAAILVKMLRKPRKK